MRLTVIHMTMSRLSGTLTMMMRVMPTTTVRTIRTTRRMPCRSAWVPGSLEHPSGDRSPIRLRRAGTFSDWTDLR